MRSQVKALLQPQDDLSLTTVPVCASLRRVIGAEVGENEGAVELG